jgi:hypothetical protein
MKWDDLHRSFLSALEKKIPEKAKLIETLSDTIFMEKGAIYRRLRGEVPFSFFEVVNIVEKLDISLNSIIYTDASNIDRTELTIVEYANLNVKECEDYVSFIALAKNDPQSEFAESANVLPVSIFTGFDALSKFLMFKYQHLFSGTENRITFSDYVFTEKIQQIFRKFFYDMKHFANTIYVWDYMIFRYLVTDLKFFSSINLISEDDLKLIRTDLFAFLDYIEEIAINGCFEETGNSVSFYISDSNFNTNYCSVKINDIHISHVKSFILNSAQSFDKSSYRKINNWIHSLKRSSTLITKSGAVYRADFFDNQRMIISEL